jgi:broad specificity phosphatase PhoE
MRKLLLVRHAEPSQSGVFLGRLDPGLSEHGERTAREELAGISVQATYSSPLRRALETAQFIEGGALQVLEGLTEIGFGAWEGMSWEDVGQRDPELARRKMENWFSVVPPAGEPWDKFEQRVARALETIRLGPAPAAVVAHIGVNAVIANLLAGESPLEFRQEYCEVKVYDLDIRA